MSIKSPQVRKQFLQRLGQMIPVRGKTVNCGVAPKKVLLQAPWEPPRQKLDGLLPGIYLYLYV